jgi:large-conductance mechanosensitive channel
MEVTSGALVYVPVIFAIVALIVFGRLQANKQAKHLEDVLESNSELVIATRELTNEIRELKSVLKDKK